MVEKYICLKDFPARPENKPHGADSLRRGPFVLATDYAALEAERDEWKRRCEKMAKEISASLIHSNPTIVHQHLTEALAIAEGRDNG